MLSKAVPVTLPLASRTCAAHSAMPLAASTVMVPPVFCAPTLEPASMLSMSRRPPDLTVMSSPSAKLTILRTDTLPPASTLMAPSCALMSSTTRALDSLMSMAPAPVLTARSVPISVLAWIWPATSTSSRLAMKTEALSVTRLLARTVSVPVRSSARTRPPLSVRSPETSKRTFLAGSKPEMPPTKPDSVSDDALSATWTSRAARSSYSAAGSAVRRTTMSPVCCVALRSLTVSLRSPSPFQSTCRSDSLSTV